MLIRVLLAFRAVQPSNPPLPLAAPTVLTLGGTPSVLPHYAHPFAWDTACREITTKSASCPLMMNPSSPLTIQSPPSQPARVAGVGTTRGLRERQAQDSLASTALIPNDELHDDITTYRARTSAVTSSRIMRRCASAAAFLPISMAPSIHPK